MTIKERITKITAHLGDKSSRRALAIICLCAAAFTALLALNRASRGSRTEGDGAPGQESWRRSALPQFSDAAPGKEMDDRSMMSQHRRVKAERDALPPGAQDLWERSTPEDSSPTLVSGKSRQETRGEQQQDEGVPVGTDAYAFFGVNASPPQSSTGPLPSTRTSGPSRRIRTPEETLSQGDEFLKSRGIDPATGLPLPREEQPNGQESDRTAEKEEVKDTDAPMVASPLRRSGGISSLDDETASLENLDTGDEFIREDASHPYRVMFIRSQKVQEGDRVTLRLLEDMPVDGILIPGNTHLMATVSIGGRLELKISSFEMNGRLYSMSYSAYDNDGGKGLYCPQTNANRKTKEGATQGGDLASSVLQTGVAGIAGRVVAAGTSIMKSSSGNVTVTLVSGYEFYVMKDGKNR